VTEQQTVTVAGVPVTVQAADGVLTVTIGRFDPAAAGALLHVHPRFGTASVGVYIANETGDTTHRPDQRWFFDLYPARAMRRKASVCAMAASQPPPACPPNAKTAARKTPATRALCLRASSDECQWYGTPGRLREVSRADVGHLLPAVGEEHEGLWFLHFADGRRGPYPSAQAAWDDWHASPAAARLDRLHRGGTLVLPHWHPDGRRQPLHRPGVTARRHPHAARHPRIRRLSRR
jgi:hypothetical protein